MIIENSPAFEKEMQARQRERENENKRNDKMRRAAMSKIEWPTLPWQSIEDFPFAAMEYEKILLTDGKTVTLASVQSRIGTPIFWKNAPERVMRDGKMHFIGGEEDPRPDLPKWWWKWEFRDELKPSHTYYECDYQPEVDFVATHWLPLPPAPGK